MSCAATALRARRARARSASRSAGSAAPRSSRSQPKLTRRCGASSSARLASNTMTLDERSLGAPRPRGTRIDLRDARRHWPRARRSPRHINSSLSLLALGGPHRRQRPPSPAAGPFAVRLAVNALRRLGESFAAVLRQTVLAELAGAPPLEPTVLGQPRGRGAHQALIQAKGRRQRNQAAQGDRAAARHDGIAEQGHDQRAAAQRPLTAKAGDQFGGSTASASARSWRRAGS